MGAPYPTRLESSQGTATVVECYLGLAPRERGLDSPSSSDWPGSSVAALRCATAGMGGLRLA